MEGRFGLKLAVCLTVLVNGLIHSIYQQLAVWSALIAEDVVPHLCIQLRLTANEWCTDA